MKFFIYFLFVFALNIASYSQSGITDVIYQKLDRSSFEMVLLDNKTLLSCGNKITDYKVGDEKMLWKNELNKMPPGWIQENTICIGIGEHSYLFVAKDQIEVNFSEQDLDTIMQYLENKTYNSDSAGIITTLENNFGNLPNVMGDDPKVIIYYTELQSFGGSIIPGYFYRFDLMSESEASMYGYHSNETEMIYMSCYPLKASSKYNISILIRELQQLIHFVNDPDEDTWVTEGLSQYAMWTCGIPTDFLEFHNYPQISLFNWSKTNLDSAKLMLFFTYLAEIYGGAEFTKQLVIDTLNGIDGINSTLDAMGFSEDFEMIFTDWAIANYVNDSNFDNGKYGYENLVLPKFKSEQQFTGFPISANSYLKSFATRYYELPTDFVKLNLNLSLLFGTNWSTSLIAYEGNTAKELIKSTDGKLTFNQPESYNLSKLVLVVTRTDNSLDSAVFSFDAQNITGIENNEMSATSKLRVYPNPVLEEALIAYEVKEPGNVNIMLLDLFGREIKELRNAFDPTGNHLIQCDVNSLQPGTYLIKMTINDKVFIQKLIKY